MAGFSVGGLATGLDTKTMIAQLLQVERSDQSDEGSPYRS